MKWELKGLVYCLRNDFTHLVIPDLIRNPVFSIWIPAGVYPVLDTGQEGQLLDHCKAVIETLHLWSSGRFLRKTRVHEPLNPRTLFRKSGSRAWGI